jgi:hypothetical protein
VDQDVGDPGQLLADAVPDTGSDLVRGSHADFRIHFEVQIDVVLEAGLAGEAFFYTRDIVNAERDLPVVRMEPSSGIVSIRCIAES